MVWAVFAALTALAALVVLVPMARAGRHDAADAGAPAAAIYADQLAELDRDVARGILPVREADAARAEIGRRLIRAAQPAAPASPPRRWRETAAAVLAIVGLPVLAIGFYGGFGAPTMPDQPLALRQAGPAEAENLDALVARVEGHLAQNPDDGQGWAVLAPVYLRVGRYTDAASAFANAIRVSGATSELEAGLGEALTGDAGGVITVDARAAFARAASLDPAAIRPRFFLALALGQDGRTDDARAAWRAIIDGAAGDEPWLPIAREQLAALPSGDAPAAGAAAGAALPAPSAADVEAAAGMSPADRAAMIGGMVDGLSARLAADGGPVEDWLRLIRSYGVLGRTDDARAALASARAAHPGAAEVRRLDEAAAGLGLTE